MLPLAIAGWHMPRHNWSFFRGVVAGSKHFFVLCKEGFPALLFGDFSIFVVGFDQVICKFIAINLNKEIIKLGSHILNHSKILVSFGELLKTRPLVKFTL